MRYTNYEDDSLSHERDGCDHDTWEDYERERSHPINQEPEARTKDGLTHRKRLNPERTIKPMER